MRRVPQEWNVLFVVGVVLVASSAYFLARWVRIFDQVCGHDARVAEVGSIFPPGLRGPLPSRLFGSVVAAAGLVGAVVLTRHSGLRKWLGVAALGGGGLPCVLFVRTLP